MMNRFLLRAQTRAVLPHGCVLHGSCVAADDRACVFLAPSGGGKSTIASVLATRGFGMIADDSVVLAEGTDGVIRCLPCGSMKQYAGTEEISGAPLRAVFFVEKGSPGTVIAMNPTQAFYRVLRTRSIMAYGHLEAEERLQARLFLARLFRAFPCGVLRYGPGENPGELIHGL